MIKSKVIVKRNKQILKRKSSKTKSEKGFKKRRSKSSRR